MVEQKEIACVIDGMAEHAQYELIQQPPAEGTSGHIFLLLASKFIPS